MSAFVLQERTYWLVKRMVSHYKTIRFAKRKHTF